MPRQRGNIMNAPTANAASTPLKTIRVFCLQCQSDSQGVSECADTACPFHDYRHGKRLNSGEHRPLKACREYCTKYCLPEATAKEIHACGGDTALLGPCPVFPFRLGTNPNISAETRAKRRQVAIKHNSLGLNMALTSLIHGSFSAPESTEKKPAGL